jgi:hypothetical protein
MGRSTLNSASKSGGREPPRADAIRRSRPDAAALIGLASAIAALALTAPAKALPAFAAQTGQPCQACHVGGFGPQLTPFGRNFKLHAYTLRTTGLTVPLSAMVEGSYVRTDKTPSSPPAPHNALNDNFTLDQASLFFAGGFGHHFGAFVQATYDGVARAFHWDNLDLRATTSTAALGKDVVLGVSLNNSPTVQDQWNTLPAWGYPYSASSLSPAPATAPLLNGALAQTSLGATAYAWIDSHWYLEAGAYGSPGATSLTRLGVDPTAPGDIAGLAPYARLAYQGQAASGTWEVGAFGLKANIHPGLDRTTGLVDLYADRGFDGSWYRAFGNGDVITLNARWLWERQELAATCALAGAPRSCADNDLTDARLDAAYYWRNRIGFTTQLFDTFAGANPILYAGNRTFRPDSSGVMLQLDGTPFGGDPQPARRTNLRLGVQYTIYSQFNGARSNFDGAGANAPDNNTFRVFSWIAY